MQTRPDYSSYHLHELEAALANIDESTNPEEAKIIREYIEKGGYTYPKESEVAGVRFVSATYKWFLVSVLAVLFVANLYFLAVDHRIIALIPLTLQGGLLFMIQKNHKYTRSLIKIWSALLIISGSFGILSMFYTTEVNWPKLADNVFKLGGGLLFFALSNRFVELVLVSSNKPLEPTR
jgi:hypothetical protein